MPMSDYLKSALLNHIFRDTAFTSPTNVFVSLWMGDPEGAGTEVDYTGYARVSVATTNAQWDAPAETSNVFWTANTNAVSFPNATGNASGAATHWAIYDASSGGNRLYSDTLTTSRTIQNGDTGISFAAGALDIGQG
jgi:hypothetical protein